MAKNEEQTDIKQKIRDVLRQVKSNQNEQDLIKELPPYNQYVASLHYRYRLLKISFVGFVVLSVSLMGLQVYEKKSLFDRLEEKEVFLVPGTIPNILKVRANTLSDALVYEFADWFIDNLGNINFEEAAYKVQTMASYMSSDLKPRFIAEMRTKVASWTSMKVDHRFAFEPIKTFERKTEGRNTRFTVQVWGVARQSMEGRDLPSYRERITLVFQTRPVSSEKIWLFEVVAMERKTSQELDDEKAVQPPQEEKK